MVCFHGQEPVGAGASKHHVGKGSGMKRLLLCAVLVVGLAGPAMSAYFDGNYILRTCRDKTDNEKRAFCMGYVGGVSDTIDTTVRGKLCKPEGVTLPQIVDLAIAWLENFPQHRHQNANEIIGVALINAFPCR